MYQVQMNEKSLYDNIETIDEASQLAISYIEKNLQKPKFNSNVKNDLSSIIIFDVDKEK